MSNTSRGASGSHRAFIHGRRDRGFGYAEVSNRVLAPQAKRVGVEVRYQGSALEQPHVVLCRLANTGSTPIRADESSPDGGLQSRHRRLLVVQRRTPVHRQRHPRAGS